MTIRCAPGPNSDQNTVSDPACSLIACTPDAKRKLVVIPARQSQWPERHTRSYPITDDATVNINRISDHIQLVLRKPIQVP